MSKLKSPWESHSCDSHNQPTKDKTDSNPDYRVEYDQRLGAFTIMKGKNLCVTIPRRVCDADPIALDAIGAYQVAHDICAAIRTKTIQLP